MWLWQTSLTGLYSTELSIILLVNLDSVQGFSKCMALCFINYRKFNKVFADGKV